MGVAMLAEQGSGRRFQLGCDPYTPKTPGRKKSFGKKVEKKSGGVFKRRGVQFR